MLFFGTYPISILSVQQIGRLHTEHMRQPVNYVDAGGIQAALKGADISPVELRAMRQLFL